MSSLTSPARTRVPRTAAIAVEKARLALVPTGRSQAPRAPFAILVLAILGAGVVGLLMFNTHMQQSSIYATKLQERAYQLTAERESLDMELERLRDPQRLGAAAKKLGMVAPATPAFLNLSDGRVTGEPTMTTTGDSVRITPHAARRPVTLNPPPVHKKVLAGNSGQTQNANGPASGNTGNAAGRNGAGTTPQGATR